MEGKAAIEPINSPLESGAEALRLAMIQMRKLGYHSVTFYGDSSELYDTLSRNLSQGRNNILKGSQCPTYMEGIAILAIGEEYNFYFQKNKSSCNDS